MLLRSQIMQRNVLFGLEQIMLEPGTPKPGFNIVDSNSLKPSSYQMYHQGLYLKHSTLCPQTAVDHSVWF
jgi:hypothetical protein